MSSSVLSEEKIRSCHLQIELMGTNMTIPFQHTVNDHNDLLTTPLLLEIALL
jgi:hypothetical protein